MQLDALGAQLQHVDPAHPAAAETRKLVGEYLPETIDAYARIPAHLRREERAGATPDQQLVDSLTRISGEIDHVTRALADGALDDLAIRTRYLDYKFGGALEDQSAPRRAAIAGEAVMQVAIPHDLGRAEVRRRLRSRNHELAGAIPGGMAEVATDWPSEDRMNLSVQAMGQVVSGHIDIRDTEIEVVLMLPPALGFIQPMVESAVRQQGHKLLAPPTAG